MAGCHGQMNVQQQLHIIWDAPCEFLFNICVYFGVYSQS